MTHPIRSFMVVGTLAVSALSGVYACDSSAETQAKAAPPAKSEAPPCRRHAGTVSTGSLPLAADDDRVDRSGSDGDGRLCSPSESW